MSDDRPDDLMAALRASIEAAKKSRISRDERRALEADAMLEPSPSAMLAGIHVTRYRPQDCACRGKHQHRFGYTQDCTVPDCTCSGFDQITT